MRSEYIRRLVEKHFNVNLACKTRKQYIIWPRMVFYALCEKYCKEEAGSIIARKLGFDHATRLHAINRFHEYKSQAFFNTYKSAYDAIDVYIEENRLHKVIDLKSKTPKEVEDAYKLKFLRLIEQRQIVVNNMKRKCALFEQDEVFQEVFNLPPEDVEEFKKLAEVFLKRKRSAILAQ